MKFLLKAFFHLKSPWNSIFKLELLKDILVKIIVPLIQEEILSYQMKKHPTKAERMHRF